MVCLAEIGDNFEVDCLSLGFALGLDAFLGVPFGFETASGVLSVSLISPSSRLSSASEAAAFVRDATLFLIAEGGAMVDGVDSSSP